MKNAYVGTASFSTKRLFLRPFCKEDALPMYEGYASSEKVTKFMSWPAHSSPADSEKVIAEWLPLYAGPEYYQWAVCLKETGKLVGAIGAFAPRGEGCPAQEGVLEIGYCLGEAQWGKGYATEALRGVLSYLVLIGKTQFVACHAIENPASGRVMEHVGFHYTHNGNYYKLNGTPVPCRWYALSREELILSQLNFK